MSVNKVILLGNVGADPEVRDSQSGKWATFRLATTDKGYTRKDGTQVPERTEWHSIIANGSVVQVIENYVRKGTKLYIEGELRSRKYTDRNNQERTATEVHVRDLQLVGARPESQQSANVPFAAQQAYQQRQSSMLYYPSMSDNMNQPPF